MFPIWPDLVFARRRQAAHHRTHNGSALAEQRRRDRLRLRSPLRAGGEPLEARQMLSATTLACYPLSTPQAPLPTAAAVSHAALAPTAESLVNYAPQSAPANDPTISLADDAQPTNASTGDNTFGSAEAVVDSLIEDALERYSHYFGTPGTGFSPVHPLIWAIEDGGMLLRDNATMLYTSVSGTYNTNTQVADVDEADLMESDGRYVYTVTGNRLVIVDLERPNDLSVVSNTQLIGASRSIYLAGNRLVVLSTSSPTSQWPNWGQPYFVHPTPTTWVTTFDVTDPANPNQVAQIEVDGSVAESRLVGSHLVLVSTNNWYLPPPQIVPGTENAWPDGAFPGYGGTYGLFETQEQYVARVRPHALEMVLPGWSQPQGDDEITQLVVDPAEIVRPANRYDATLVTVSSWDVSGDWQAPVDVQSQVLAGLSATYMSSDRLVLAAASAGTPFAIDETTGNLLPISPSPTGDESPGVILAGLNATDLVSISVDADSGDLEWEAAGRIPGRLVDRFALDERNDILRAATIVDSPLGNSTSAHLYTLAIEDGQWITIGSLTGLAPGETMRSVRFTDDRAYVVTFPIPEQTFIPLNDPLFVIDLTDDGHPSVMGELIVSGFSSYLQVLDETLVLGIGREIDPESGRDLGMQLSLFDVTDTSAPKLIDRHHIEQWSTSDAEFDLHALTYDPTTGLLALPVHVQDIGLDVIEFPWLRTLETFPADLAENPAAPKSGVYVFGVNPDEGFQSFGLAHVAGNNGRSIIVDNYLVARTDDILATFNLDTLDQRLDHVNLSSRAVPDHFEVTASANPIPVDVLANDIAAENATLTIVGVHGANAGWSISEDGTHLLLDTNAALTGSYADGQPLLYYPTSYTVRDSFGVEHTASIMVVIQSSLSVAHDSYILANTSEHHVLSVLDNDTSNAGDDTIVITSLMTESAHGHVAISSDQRTLVYTPNPGFVGTDDFSYIATDGYGNSRIGHVMVTVHETQVPSEHQMAFDIEVLGADDRPVSSVVEGAQFYVDVYVQDLRPDGSGVFSAYVDLNFNGVAVDIDPQIIRGPMFPNGLGGTLQANGVDELGGLGGLTPPGAARQLLARVLVTAQESGTLRVQLTPAELPESDNTLYGLNQEIPKNYVRYDASTVNVVTSRPGDINGDGTVSPLDALLVINALQRDMVFAEDEHLDEALASQSGVVFFGSEAASLYARRTEARWFSRRDANRDGVISPLDALIVINELFVKSPK